MDSRKKTMVINIMDGRTALYDLPPDRAVVAAFEEHDNLTIDESTLDESTLASPGALTGLKEYRRGYACGDWVAYKLQSCETI